MLGLLQVYVLTSLSMTQTRALAASSLMLRRARLDSRLVHRERAITKSRPRMALSELVGRSDAEGEVRSHFHVGGSVPEPLPKRLLYVEPLRRRMRARFGGTWIADSEHVLLLFEPGR